MVEGKTITKYLCSKCKKEFENRYDVCHFTSSFSKKGVKKYYYCHSCQTERLRKYRHTETGRIKTREALRRSTKKYEYKQKARIELTKAVKRGDVIKPSTCIDCSGKLPVEGHHSDYNEPLSVSWLCRPCHARMHSMV